MFGEYPPAFAYLHIVRQYEGSLSSDSSHNNTAAFVASAIALANIYGTDVLGGCTYLGPNNSHHLGEISFDDEPNESTYADFTAEIPCPSEYPPSDTILASSGYSSVDQAVRVHDANL